MQKEVRVKFKAIALTCLIPGIAVLLIIGYLLTLPLGRLDFATADSIPGKVYREVLFSWKIFVFGVVPGLCVLHLFVAARILYLLKQLQTTSAEEPGRAFSTRAG